MGTTITAWVPNMGMFVFGFIVAVILVISVDVACRENLLIGLPVFAFIGILGLVKSIELQDIINPLSQSNLWASFWFGLAAPLILLSLVIVVIFLIKGKG